MRQSNNLQFVGVYSYFPLLQVFMSAASHPVVSLIFPCPSSSFCIFCRLPSCQLVSTERGVLVPPCLEGRITLIPLQFECCPAVEFSFLHSNNPSLSTSTWLHSRWLLKEAKQNLNASWLSRAVMGVAGLAAPGIDPESTCSLGQCIFPVQGARGDGNQLSSVTRTPVKTVWLCMSWTFVFLSPCLLIASKCSLSIPAWKLILRLNLKKLTLIVLGALPTIRC